jgi:hypothetical protein
MRYTLFLLMLCSVVYGADQPSVSFDVQRATDDQLALVKKAEKALDLTVRSQCFADVIMSTKMVMTKGQSNQQVLDSLRAERGVIPVVVYYQPWYKPSKVVGFTYATDPAIHFRDAALHSVCDVASLAGHEGMGHKLGGYDHSYRHPEKNSVPYTINAAVDKCCPNLL